MAIHHTNAATVTYAAAGSTVIMWGLHWSDIAVGISTVAAVAGLGLQAYQTWVMLRDARRERAAKKNVDTP